MGKITIPLLVVDFLLNFSCSLSGYPLVPKFFSHTPARSLLFSFCGFVSLSYMLFTPYFIYLFFFAFLNFANHGPFFAPI